MPMKKPLGSVITSVMETLFKKQNFPLIPMTAAEKLQMAEEAMADLVDELVRGNNFQPSGCKYRIPDDLADLAVAMLANYAYKIKFVDTGGGSKDSDILAIYGYEKGPGQGLYITDRTYIAQCLRAFAPTLTEPHIDNIISILRGMAEHVDRCNDKNLIPVNNGVFDYRTKELLPFSPDYVFLTKTRVNYVDNPTNPVIHNPDDRTDWDVESWIQSLTDDPEIVELLWEVIGAVVRPGEVWDKAVFLYSKEGSNGKGTLCRLLRNLCGSKAHTGLKIDNLDRDFMLESLLTASAIIADENDVGNYIERAGNFKAIVTRDTICINRKYKTPIQLRFTGVVVQCINSLPHFRDKSNSLYRRLLPIPFNKCFTGAERKYIKEDYMSRPEVLEYVLHKVLHMDYHHLSEPAACRQLLAEYKTDNDTVRQFADDVLPVCVWDLLPLTFLHELYVAWMRRFYPGTKALGRNNFYKDFLQILPEYPDWECADKGKEYASKGRMDKPELLILEYDVKNWYNPSYQGPDPNKRCTIHPNLKYRGILRVAAGGAATAGDDDDE